MLSQFGAFIPQLWYEDGALVRAEEPAPRDEAATAENVDEAVGERTNPVRMAVSDTIAVNRVVLSSPPSSSLLSGYAMAGGDWPSANYPPHSTSAMNDEFTKLFADFRKGVQLINNEQIREKAKAAARLRNNRPEDAAAWAKKLADDVKDADD